ncbi:hypothetical protein [Streptomyces tricolor]
MSKVETGRMVPSRDVLDRLLGALRCRCCRRRYDR